MISREIFTITNLRDFSIPVHVQHLQLQREKNNTQLPTKHFFNFLNLRTTLKLLVAGTDPKIKSSIVSESGGQEYCHIHLVCRIRVSERF